MSIDDQIIEELRKYFKELPNIKPLTATVEFDAGSKEQALEMWITYTPPGGHYSISFEPKESEWHVVEKVNDAYLRTVGGYANFPDALNAM